MSREIIIQTAKTETYSQVLSASLSQQFARSIVTNLSVSSRCNLLVHANANYNFVSDSEFCHSSHNEAIYDSWQSKWNECEQFCLLKNLQEITPACGGHFTMCCDKMAAKNITWRLTVAAGSSWRWLERSGEGLTLRERSGSNRLLSWHEHNDTHSNYGNGGANQVPAIGPDVVEGPGPGEW